MNLTVDSRHSVDGRVKPDRLPISIVIPTYRRDSVLIATIKHLLDLDQTPAEILVLDQTEKHQEAVENTLRDWEMAGAIKLIRLAEPSIPRAMNRGLCEARQDIVLFVDDDIVPEPGIASKAFVRIGKDRSSFDCRTGSPAMARRKGLFNARRLSFCLDASGMDR